MVHIEVIGPVPDLSWWKELAGLYLRESLGREFSIHCWKDEKAEIQQALRYGTVRPSVWAYGTEMTGPVTEAFADFLLETARFQPTGPDGGAQMTPFFSVFLGDVFSSSHYGRELDVRPIAGEGAADWTALRERLARQEWLTVYDYEG